jgi:hypothetical protein
VLVKKPARVDSARLLNCEPPVGIEPMTYALRACPVRCLRVGGSVLRCGLPGVAVGDHWLLTALRGHLGGTTAASRGDVRRLLNFNDRFTWRIVASA